MHERSFDDTCAYTQHGNIMKRAYSTFTVESSLVFLLGRELANAIMIISKEVQGKVPHVLLCEMK